MFRKYGTSLPHHHDPNVTIEYLLQHNSITDPKSIFFNHLFLNIPNQQVIKKQITNISYQKTNN